MESYRLREMEEVLTEPYVWDDSRNPVDIRPAGVQPSRPSFHPRAPIRVGERKRQRACNPYPAFITLEDDSSGVRSGNRSNSSSITSVHTNARRKNTY
jgi:hypothetical protein